MAKYTGNYTNEAVKVIRQSERLECQVTEDETIYICNGYLIFKMNPMEYASLVQPVTCCDAGNWRIDSTGKKPGTIDVEKIFSENVTKAKNAATMEPCKMVFSQNKKEMVGFYSRGGDFTAIYNKSFVSAILPGAEWKSTGKLSAAVAFSSVEAFAMVLPIKPVPNICRAVKAYFAEDDGPSTDSLLSDLEETKKKLTDALDQIASQSAELELLREAKQPEVQPEKTQSVMDIAARFSGISGITATVKGAQTGSPVIWLSGDTESHREEIKAAGAKWSTKRGAYYYRVA